MSAVPAEIIDESQDRQTRLASATAGLRRTASGLPADRWLQLSGWVLVPAGVALILLGWHGAANTTRVWEQVPYLISGGLFGMALVFAGAFGYFASWMTQMVEESRRQAQEANEAATRMAATLERIEEAFAAQPNGEGKPTPASLAEGSLVATPTGSMAHRPDCPVVAGKSGLRTVRAGQSDLQPCAICEPEWPEPRPRNRTRSR